MVWKKIIDAPRDGTVIWARDDSRQSSYYVRFLTRAMLAVLNREGHPSGWYNCNPDGSECGPDLSGSEDLVGSVVGEAPFEILWEAANATAAIKIHNPAVMPRMMARR